MSALSFDELRDLAPFGQSGVTDAPCPLCASSEEMGGRINPTKKPQSHE